MDIAEESVFDIIPLPSEAIAESTRRVRLKANSSFNDFLSMRKYSIRRREETRLRRLSKSSLERMYVISIYGRDMVIFVLNS